MQFVLDVKNGVITEDIKTSLKSVVFDIFSFRVTRRLVSGCPMLGLTPVTKMILKLSFNLYLLIILLILYVTTGLRRRLQKEPSQKLGIFVARLSRCSMAIILLNYTTFADVSLTLLKCVTVQDKKVLFIDGETVCFAYWQYIVMGCVICFIAPVFLALLIGVPLLNSKIIPAKNFVLALIMPLPFIFLFLKRIKPVQFKESDTNGQDRTLKAASPVLQVLVKPYAREDGSGPIYWEGILLLRRFILVVIVVSIGNAVIRLYVLFAVIIIMLFHHNYVRPFRYPSINMAETISLLILALLCAINAFFARNLNDGQQLKGADILLAKTFEWVVTIIALTIPVALITFVLAAIIIRLVNLSYFGIKKLFCSKKASEIETGSLLNGKGRSYEAMETKSERPSPLQESV